MPNYEFICEDCGHSFCRLLSIDNRNTPLDEGCEKCNSKSINKEYSINPLILSDNTMTANKKTGGQWNELMSKMKSGMPKRYHERLDIASSRTSRRFMG
jgi:putative FmdB family regulatory protein